MSFERTRSQGNMAANPGYTYQLKAACGSWGSPVQVSIPGFSLGSSRVMTDVVDPEFFSKKNRGEVVFSPMNFTEVNAVLAPNGFFQYRAGPVGCGGYQDYAEGVNSRSAPDYHFAFTWGAYTGGGARYVDMLSASDMNAAIVEASTKAQSERGKAAANMFETIGELHQVYRLLPGLFEQMQIILRRDGLFLRTHNGQALVTRETNSAGGTAKRYKTRAVLGKAGAVSGLYLMARYGIGPIISDINTILKAGDKAIGKLRRTSRGSILLAASDQLNLSAPLGNVRFDAVLSRSDSYSVRAMALDEVDVTAALNRGFGLKEYLTAPWELFPLSFVWDWFINVQDYLRALVPLLGIHPLGSCYTVERNQMVSLSMLGQTGIGGGLEVVASDRGTATVTTNRKQRTVGLPTAGLVVKSDFRFDHVTRSLDAAALTHMRFARVLDNIAKSLGPQDNPSIGRLLRSRDR